MRRSMQVLQCSEIITSYLFLALTIDKFYTRVVFPYYIG